MNTKRLHLFVEMFIYLVSCVIHVLRIAILVKFTLIIELSGASFPRSFLSHTFGSMSAAYNLFKDEIYNFQMSFWCFFFSRLALSAHNKRILCRNLKKISATYWYFLHFLLAIHTHAPKQSLQSSRNHNINTT